MRNTPAAKLFVIISFSILVLLGFWAYFEFFKSTDSRPSPEDLIVLQPVDSLLQSAADNNPTGVKYAVNNSSKPARPVQAVATRAITHNPQPANPEIIELNRKVDKLIDRNNEIENENRKLSEKLKSLSDAINLPRTEKQSGQHLSKNTRPKAETQAPVTEKVKKSNLVTSTEVAKSEPVSKPAASPHVSSTEPNYLEGISLTAFCVINSNEFETSLAMRTDKLVGTLRLPSHAIAQAASEIYIVLLQPDGRVLQKSPWESGTFLSVSGKKIYTCKLSANQASAGNNQLNFSLPSDSFQQGLYTLQVYYGGKLIGELKKPLS